MDDGRGWLNISKLLNAACFHQQERESKSQFPSCPTDSSLVVQTVNNLPPIDLGSVPRSGRSPGERNGYLIQYSCLENSMDREAWRAMDHGVAKSQIQLK